MQKMERQELLQRRNNGGSANGGILGGRGSADTEAQMMRSVAQSNMVLEDIFGQGSAILAGMATQRDRLKVSLAQPSHFVDVHLSGLPLTNTTTFAKFSLNSLTRFPQPPRVGI